MKTERRAAQIRRESSLSARSAGREGMFKAYDPRTYRPKRVHSGEEIMQRIKQVLPVALMVVTAGLFIAPYGVEAGTLGYYLYVHKTTVGGDVGRWVWLSDVTYPVPYGPTKTIEELEGLSLSLKCRLDGGKLQREFNYGVSRDLEIATALRKQIVPVEYITDYKCREIGKGPPGADAITKQKSMLSVKRTPLGKDETHGTWGTVPTLVYVVGANEKVRREQFQYCLQDGKRLQGEVNSIVSREAEMARNLGKRQPLYYISDVKCERGK